MGDNKKSVKMNQLVDWHLDRLGIEDKDSARHNLLNVFMPTILEMESSGNYQAANKVSTAKGGFQFIEGSVEPALNRLERRIGTQDWGAELRKHKDASKLTPEQQELLFMADMLEKKGSDEYMRKVMSGDKQGSMDAYYKLHHTAPDDATIKRAEKIFGEVYKEEDMSEKGPMGKRIVGEEGDNYLTNYGSGTIPKSELRERIRLGELTQVQSDDLARGFSKNFPKFMEYMFNLRLGPNKPGEEQ